MTARFPLGPAGEDHPSSPAAVPAAPSRAHDGGAAAERAIEGVPPSPLAPAPESAPPALPEAARPSLFPGRDGLAQDPPGGARTSAPVLRGSGAEREQPGGTTPAAGLTPAQSPAGGAPDTSSASPAGSTPLDGKAFRDAVKAAESANAKAKRNGRGRYPVKRRGDGYKPGMTRRMPPGGGQ